MKEMHLNSELDYVPGKRLNFDCRCLYIADWHYGHTNCIRFDKRPFVSVDEMNRTLIDNWNSVVSSADTVFILGDMFWKSLPECVGVLNELRGNKILIVGNHDKTVGNDVFLKHFELVTSYLDIADKNRRVCLSHYPICCFNGYHRGWRHIYGHIHNNFENRLIKDFRDSVWIETGIRPRMYNAGVMMPYMNYFPRTLTEIINAVGDEDDIKQNTEVIAKF